MEFSGQMIVRPLQPDVLAKRGKGAFEQFVIRDRAAKRIETETTEYIEATDEYVIDLPIGENENSYSRRLMATGDYQYVEPNWICYPQLTPNDPQFGQQWHHAVVKSPEAWNFFTGSPTIICAVVDTGIDLTHPDLSPNRVPGYNSVDQLAEVNGGQVNDLNGHGTHVAGDAAAFGNNALGVCGMGWNFKVMMVRTSNSAGGGASTTQITNGARWAAENGARVVSASYSGVDAAAVGTTGTYIKTRNALFCYAAGNDNRNLNGFNHPDTIVVGASDPNDQKAGFSAFGPAVHVFAPGVNILSTTLGGGYGNASGTSMATPVCNGVIGLIFAAKPTLTPNQAQAILEANCDNIGPSSIFGYGRVNQLKNMQAVFASNPIDSQPIAINVYVGTHLGGTLGDILNPNSGGPTYDIGSALVDRLGYAAGAEVTYQISASPASLRSLEFFFQSKLNQKMSVTGFVYAKNVQTGLYDLLGQFPSGDSIFVTRSVKITTNLTKYAAADGTVKCLLRTVGAKFGGRVAPAPFILKIGHVKLAYTSQ